MLLSDGGTRIKNPTMRLRNSRLGRATFRKIPGDIKTSENDESDILPLNFEDWRRIIVRFNLKDSAPLPDRVVVHRLIDSALISTSAELAWKFYFYRMPRVFSATMRTLQQFRNYGTLLLFSPPSP